MRTFQHVHLTSYQALTLVVSALIFFATVLMSCRSRFGDETTLSKAEKELEKPDPFNILARKTVQIDGRSAQIYWNQHTQKKRKPLVLFLHGFGNEPQSLAMHFGLPYEVVENNFVLLIPKAEEGFDLNDGRKIGWNATESCCGWGTRDLHTKEGGPQKRTFRGQVVPNDLDYLKRLVTAVITEPDLNIDTKRVYAFGYSNGGFMAHTLACHATDLFRGIASYAGSSFKDANECKPTSPIKVLQIHGNLDQIIFYNEAERSKVPGVPEFPFPEEVVGRWLKHNECSDEYVVKRDSLLKAGFHQNPNFVGGPNVVSISTDQAKAEQTEQRLYKGCRPGGEVEFWTIDNGTHLSEFKVRPFDKIWKFLNR